MSQNSQFLPMLILLSTVAVPTVVFTPAASTHYVGEHLNATCTSSISGVLFSWRVTSVETGQTLFEPSNIVSTSPHASVAVFTPITFYFNEPTNVACQISSDNPNLLQAEAMRELAIEGQISFVYNILYWRHKMSQCL